MINIRRKAFPMCNLSFFFSLLAAMIILAIPAGSVSSIPPASSVEILSLNNAAVHAEDSIRENPDPRNGNPAAIHLLEKPRKEKNTNNNQKFLRASASSTYTLGDIETDRGFTTVSQSSSCPGSLTVTIPSGAIITSVDVAYDMTALANASISQQRSQLRCVSPGGTSELSVYEGVGNSNGTYSYSRSGLDIANGVSGGGDIEFELHAGRTSNGNGCKANRNKVDNNTWTVTVYYSVEPVPDFTVNPTTADVGQQVTFTDNSTGTVTSWAWDFGEDASPATATTQGPHSVTYASSGAKTVSLTVNGLFTETKLFYVSVSDASNSASATYTGGDIPTDYGFQALPGASSCPGTLTVTIPAGAVITGLDVEYDMTAQNWGWMSEQRSQLRCISPGGTSETNLATGSGDSGGTQSYSRTGLDIANAVTGGGDIQFELHAGRTWTLYGNDCSTTFNFVENNSFTVTIHFTTDPIPNFYADETFIYVGESVTFTDISGGPVSGWNWDFGSGASPPTASSQGPHTVTYNTIGLKDVSLTVNGSFTETKSDYILVSAPNNWLKWDDNVNFSSVGRNSSGIWQSAVRFEPADYSSFGSNPQITRVRVYITDVPISATLKIWQGIDNLNLVEYVSQTFTPQAESWNIIVLNTPYDVNASEELWFGVEYNDPGTDVYPAGLDAATSQNQKSNLYRIDIGDPAAWNALSGAGIDGDWNLQAYLVETGSWIGVVSSQWEDPDNWFSSSVPAASTDVVVPVTPNDPYIRSYAQVNNLTIEAGASLTIGAGRSLTVNGTLVNDAGAENLVIESNVDGTGSLLSTTAGVQGTFQRYIKGEPEAWHGLSSPMTAQPISGDFTPSGTYGDGTGYDFYTWYEPDTSWIYLLNDSYPPTWEDANGSDVFLQGKGYLVSYQDTNPTLGFSGILANGAVNVPLTLTTGIGEQFGANLVGNPYPSSIDWKAATGWTRDMLNLSGSGYNIWIWNDTAYNYGVYNSASTSDIGTLGVTRHIPPTQGFFVQAASNGNLGFSDALRVNDGSSNWLKSKGEKPEVFFMSVISVDGHGDDEILLELNHEEAESGSQKKFSFIPTAPSLWISKNGKFYSALMIDSLEQYPVLPLSFKPGKSGEFRLRAEFNRNTVKTATLTDKQTGQVYDLMKVDELTFLASDSDPTNRFVLQFSEGNFPDPHDQLPVRIFTHNQYLYIDLRLVPESCSIEMYNIAGVKVFDDINTGGTQYQIYFPNLQGAFIVSVTGNSGRKIQKIVF